MDEIKTLIDAAYPKVPSQSPLGKALFYARNHWAALNAYLYDGRLEIDNNRAERSIKPFVIGRKTGSFMAMTSAPKLEAFSFPLLKPANKIRSRSFLG